MQILRFWQGFGLLCDFEVAKTVSMVSFFFFKMQNEIIVLLFPRLKSEAHRMRQIRDNE
jgi:hypothetical protein